MVKDSAPVRVLPPADRLPTLTEVVEFAGEPWMGPPAVLRSGPAPDDLFAPAACPVAPEAEAEAGGARPAEASPMSVALVDLASRPPQAEPQQDSPQHPAPAAILDGCPQPSLSHAVLDEGQLAERVLADVQERLDALFETRMREALAPALARAADGLIRDLRPELTLALRDLIQDAVARALREPPLRAENQGL